MVREESLEGWTVNVAPVPFRLECRNTLRRARQQLGWILAGCARRSEPVSGDDSEVATASAGMRPPEVTVRVGRLPGCDNAAGPSAFVHGDHLYGIQIVCGQAELAAEEAKGAADYVPA